MSMTMKREYRTEKFKKARPLCPVHLVQMVTYCTKEQVRHLQCPVSQCKETKAQTR